MHSQVPSPLARVLSHLSAQVKAIRTAAPGVKIVTASTHSAGLAKVRAVAERAHRITVAVKVAVATVFARVRVSGHVAKAPTMRRDTQRRAASAVAASNAPGRAAIASMSATTGALLGLAAEPGANPSGSSPGGGGEDGGDGDGEPPVVGLAGWLGRGASKAGVVACA